MSVFPYVYVAEVTVWNGAAEQVLYYANQPFQTKPTDTPASTIMEPRVLQPALMQRDACGERQTTGRSTVGYGNLELANDGEGSLDFLLNGTYAVDGRSLIIRRGLLGAAYPAGFTQVFKGTMAAHTGDANTVTFHVRDQQQKLNVPFQTNKYLGNNALPNGLEGTSELTGKPKVVAYGVVKNYAPVCVNSSKLIYKVNDGSIQAVDAVYDRGSALSIGYRWSSISSGFGGTSLGIAVGNGVVLSLGSVLRRSTDNGVTWANVATPPGFTVQALDFGNGLFVAVGLTSGLATSPDGLTWTNRVNPVGTCTMISYAPGFGWIASGVNKLMTSPDAITWTAKTYPTTFTSTTMYSMAGNATTIVATSAANEVTYSLDGGTTWTLVGITVQAFAMRWLPGKAMFFMGSTSGGYIYTSPNGQGWTQRSAGVTMTFRDFAEGNGVVIAVGNDVATGALKSIDTINWTLTDTPPVSYGVAFTGTRFIIGGNAAIYGTGLSAQQYGNQTDLLDDTLAPAPGTYKFYATEGLIRLGSRPEGLITVDFKEGANAAARTTAQIWARVLQRAGIAGGGWSAADVTALDTACPGEIGLVIDSETTVDAVADMVAATPWTSWGADAAALFRIRQLTLPSGAPVVSWVQDDFIGGLSPVESGDPNFGLPTYQCVLQYARNYSPQTTDVAGIVDAARRALLAQAFQSVKSTDAAVLTAHPLATQLTEDSCFASVGDATTEVARRQTIRGTTRRWFVGTVDWDDANMAIDVNSVVSVTHPRFGLAAGVLMRVMGVKPDAHAGTLTVFLWGG